MSTTAVVLTVLTSAWVAFSGVSLLRRAAFVVDPLIAYGVPRSWWPWLGTAKLLGAAGLLAGLAVTAVGLVAAIGLVVYFVGAVVTVVRVRSWKTLAFPVLYLAPVAATLTIGFA
ncbi:MULTISPECIES: DoxX family protein [unclassified Streptomyces]|uniref:DoxX family protein n=1 Tax=unclassified Streptomyces TaxID=2593676 RepID=UPI0033DD73A5